MSETLPPCPKCSSSFTYEDASLLICPECAHEWSAHQAAQHAVKDCNGTLLNEGDSVTLARDLNVKGSNLKLKQGSAAKNIRLTDKDDEVECRFGKQTIILKTQYLKKA